MPNYQTPFGIAGGIGGGAAAAAGGGLLGRLGELLSPLDYPRQALYNTARAGYRGLTGEGSMDDFIGSLPGLAGAAAAGGLMATGAGAPLGILLGSLVGGTAQGIGHAMDDGRTDQQGAAQPNRFDAATPGDLAEMLGGDKDSMLQSMALGAVTDPLTFAGGVGGASKGAALGGSFGKNLEQIALTQGPNYAGGAAKFAEMAKAAPGPKLAERLAMLAGRPEAEALAREIPPGTSVLCAGQEALAFKTPDGQVIRIGGGPGCDTRREWKRGLEGALIPRVDMPYMAPAVRSAPIGDFRVEHVPMMDTVPDTKNMRDWTPQEASRYELLGGAESPLKKASRELGYMTADEHAWNMGQIPQGKPNAGNLMFIDPGTVEGTIPMAPTPEQFTPTEGGPLSRALLKLLGSDRTIRNEISQGMDQAFVGRGLPPELATASPVAQGGPFSQIPGIPIGGMPLKMNSAMEEEKLAAALSALVERMGGRKGSPLSSQRSPMPMNTDEIRQWLANGKQ